MRCFLFMLITLALGRCSTKNNEKKLLADDVRLYENTPVWEVAHAIEQDDTVKIRQLLLGKPDSVLNYQEKHYGQTLLQWAVYTNHYYPSVKAIAELGANPNIQSKNGTTAFIHAADKFETSDYVRLLLEYGGDVNTIAQTKEVLHLRTPLIAAAFTRLESVKLLVKAGADINYVHKELGYQSAILSACLNDQIEILNYLIIEKGADYKRALSVTANGDSSYVVDWLRNMPFPLESEQYKEKMKLVEYLKKRVMNYWEAPIPKHFYKNYDSAYLEKY